MSYSARHSRSNNFARRLRDPVPEWDVTCTGSGAPVGAFLPDGKRFDLDLPFGFPFSQIVSRRR